MRYEAMVQLVKALMKDATTTGLTTQTGLNFFYLEQQAKLIYPVFYPLLASIPRVQPMFNGIVVGGTGVNWKAITDIDTGGYPGISESNRNAFMNFTEKDYFAAYKYLGKDTQVSFQAQQTGLGLDDNIGIAQVSLLNALLNDEERMLLYGNSGSAGNGFQLGTTPTPTAALVLDSSLPAAGTIPGATAVTLFAVALTGWGTQLATGTGVKLPFSRTNADGSQDVINGGTAAISAASNTVTTDGTHHAVSGTVAAVNGALGYAWYVNSTDTTLANAVFAFVTPGPTATITALPAGTNQRGNATSSAGSLTTDNSANALDFDGLLTWAFNYKNASPKPSFVKDLGGANLTSNGDGTIAEFETALDFLWSQYKLTPDRIYLGGTLIDSVSKKIAGGGLGATATQRLMFTMDQAGKLIGGNFATAYRSKYGPGQAKQLDIMTHPWLPQGAIFFDLINNPYPAAGNAIPTVRRVVTLEDHFSIKWPYRKLQHEVGVYTFETLQHYIPFGLAVLTGVGNG